MTVKTTIKPNGIAYLCLDRPEVNNAMNAELIAAIKNGCDQLGADDAVRVVILHGAGDHFCAGADLNWMKSAVHYTEAENYDDAMRMSDMFNAVYKCAKPVIAAVHGSVYGGGIGLTAGADIALGQSTTTFCLSEVRLGLTPATISPFVIAAIGERQARRYALTAEVFDAQKAQSIGLLHEVVDDVLSAAEELAHKMIKLAPEAQQNAKALIEDMAKRTINKETREETARRIAARRASKEAQEGMNAFFEKRKPNWIKSNDA